MQDIAESDWFVKIIASGFQEFHIENLNPKEKVLWTNSKFKGSTNSIIEIRDFILIAMSGSQGWKNNKLKSLYLRNKFATDYSVACLIIKYGHWRQSFIGQRYCHECIEWQHSRLCYSGKKY